MAFDVVKGSRNRIYFFGDFTEKFHFAGRKGEVSSQKSAGNRTQKSEEGGEGLSRKCRRIIYSVRSTKRRTETIKCRQVYVWKI